MTYTILSVRQLDDTLETVVLYDFDGVQEKVAVHHFQPQSKADVILGIENRMASEERKVDAKTTIETVAAEVSADIGKPVGK